MSGCSRREFLVVLGSGALAACGSPIAGSVPVSNGMATLAYSQFPQLTSVGNGVVVEVGMRTMVVVRTGAQTAVALDAICTHQSCTLEYTPGSIHVDCPCHGAQFALDGSVTRGPALQPLTTYPAAVVGDGIAISLG